MGNGSRTQEPSTVEVSAPPGSVPEVSAQERITTEIPAAVPAAPTNTEMPVVGEVLLEPLDALLSKAHEGDVTAAQEALRRLEHLPVNVPGRLERVKDVAALLNAGFRDAPLALRAWELALTAVPGDEQSLTACVGLASQLGDDAALERHVTAWLAHHPQGARSRELRLEYVAALERMNRPQEALKALRDAVEADPKHADALHALGERLVAQGHTAEAVRMYERCVEVSYELAQQISVLQRLARLTRLHTGDEERAQAYLTRAEGFQEALDAQTAAVLEEALADAPEESDAPSTPEALAEEFDEVDSMLEARAEPEVVTASGEAGVPVEAQEAPLEAPSAPSRRTVQMVSLGDPAQSIAPSFGPSPSASLSAERAALFERVQADPLNADGYKLLAEHFDSASDATRSSLMLEIARALEGDPHAAPRSPRLVLTSTDRTGLKHPAIRGPAGEYLSLIGTSMCRLFPATGRDAGSNREFTLESGKGAKAAADALLTAVRVLGVRAPQVHEAEDAGPPFALVFARAPRTLVGKLALKKPTPDAELRFFAGRALFTQAPELLATRSLRRDQFLKALRTVQSIIEGNTTGPEAKLVRDGLTAKAWDRARVLHLQVATTLDVAALLDGARHSANRAGLVVCGGVAPAVDALRAKKALPTEMVELIRFASTERYLKLRQRTV